MESHPRPGRWTKRSQQQQQRPRLLPPEAPTLPPANRFDGGGFPACPASREDQCADSCPWSSCSRPIFARPGPLLCCALPAWAPPAPLEDSAPVPGRAARHYRDAWRWQGAPVTPSACRRGLLCDPLPELLVAERRSLVVLCAWIRNRHRPCLVSWRSPPVTSSLSRPTHDCRVASN